MAKKYETEEQKDPVVIDYEELEKIGVELIEDDLSNNRWIIHLNIIV